MIRSARTQTVLRWLGWTLVMSACMITLRWAADLAELPHGIVRGIVICGIGAFASVCFPYKAIPSGSGDLPPRA
jgi:hypothetical protein